MNELAVGLAGFGYWGTKLARNLHEAAGCRLAAVADVDSLRVAEAVRRYPGCRGFTTVDELAGDGGIEAVVLATPASNHAGHVRTSLEAGKHLLVEKPLALSTEECEELCALAASKGLTLMVGHTFVYSKPVQLLRAMIDGGELGRVLYLYAQRLNLGIVRDDLNALWNFGPHDVSIMLYLLDRLPKEVSALQYRLLNRRLEDIVFLVLEFPDGVVAHIHESWLDPRKVRHLTVVGDRKMVVYDDIDVETPIRIYDRSVVPETLLTNGMLTDEAPENDFGEFKLKVRSGEMVAPHIPAHEPLRGEIEHFVECVITGRPPLTDGAHGRDVVAVLEAAEQSARSGGARTPIGSAERRVRAPGR